MLVGSFLLFCVILQMIFRGSLKFGVSGSFITGLLFFIFVYSTSNNLEVALGAGAAMLIFTL
jgi:hypothetical protein